MYGEICGNGGMFVEKQAEHLIKGGSFIIEDVSCEDVFTPEDFSDEQKMIAKTTEEFVLQEVFPELPYIEKHEFDRTVKLLRKAGELGLLAADIPEEYGGLGLDKISSAIIAEKMSAAGGFAISHGAHVGIGSLPIVLFGNERQKKKYLPALASGEKIAAYALTEPGSGSDALGVKTTAVLNEAGTHYILNGEKQWITNSGFADIFVVYAKVDGDKFSAFIVERDFPGVSVGPEEDKMGIKGSSTRSVFLDNAEVPVENLLGEIGRGHIIAFNILNIGRYKLGLGALGGAKRVMEITIPYINQRKQFNRAISSFNLTKEKLATMAARLYAAESSIYRTVGLFEERMKRLSDKEISGGKAVADAIAEYAIECSIGKFFNTEVLDYIVDEGVQLHGGYGFMEEYEIARAYRDSRINRIFEGTNEINRLLVPGMFFRKALKNELPLYEKAAALEEELMMFMPEEPGNEPLAKEKYLLANSKKIALLTAGLAVKKFGKEIEQEQEILANIADIAANVYVMESVIVRTEKALAKEGPDKSRQKLLYTEIFCQEAFDEIERHARETIAAAVIGDDQLMMLSLLRKLTRYTTVNIIGKKREAALKLIQEEKYAV